MIYGLAAKGILDKRGGKKKIDQKIHHLETKI